MAKHTIIVKRPDKVPEIIEFEGQYRCDLKKLFGNDSNIILDYVMLGSSGDRCFAMACDQNGKFKSLDPNFNLITQSGGHKFFSNILGTAVFFCYQYEDVWEKEIWNFQLLDLEQSQISRIMTILSEPYQRYLLAEKRRNPNLHHNEMIITRFQPVQRTHLAFFFVMLGFPGLKMKFATQPDCAEEYELTVKKGKANTEKLICSGVTIARKMSFQIPAFTSGKAQCEEAFDERLRKLPKVKQSLVSIGIPKTVYVTEGDVGLVMQEVRSFEMVCLESREHYESYISMMNDFDKDTIDKIHETLKIAVNLYSPAKKRQYIEEHLSGILSPEEIAKINIENWE